MEIVYIYENVEIYCYKLILLFIFYNKDLLEIVNILKIYIENMKFHFI